jgi:hypothetical protein
MGEEIQWLNVFNAAKSRLFMEANWLWYKADALREVGMDRLADEIACCAECVSSAEQDMGRAVRQMIHEDYKRAQAETAQVLIALLDHTEKEK